MVNLKVIQIRLKSVGSIQKITKSMKMVSTAKYGKAEKLLQSVRPFGLGARVLYDHFELRDDKQDENKKLIIAITSDRGLCGAVHTQVSKLVVKEIRGIPKNNDTKVICVGEKCRYAMQYSIPSNIILSVSDIGRNPPTFTDAAKIAQKTNEIDFNIGKIVFNRFNSIVSSTTTEIPLYSYVALSTLPKLNVYSYEHDELNSFMEFSHSSLIFYTLAENSCSEQAARMTAMENASKNAAEMIDKLKLVFNRTRQTVITQELIEIISGAAALK